MYIGWRLFKYLGENNENFLWGGWQAFKDLVGNALTATSAWVLRLMGYQLSSAGRRIIVDGTRGIWVADLCLGIAPMVIFAGFILAFGNHWKNKVWFIPLGLFLIYLTNVVRIVALVLVQVHNNNYFKLAHEYVYLIITYGLISLLVLWWMEKLAFKPAATK